MKTIHHLRLIKVKNAKNVLMYNLEFLSGKISCEHSPSFSIKRKQNLMVSDETNLKYVLVKLACLC